MKVIVVLEKQSRFTIDFPEEVAKQKYTNAVMGMIQNQSSIKSNFSFTKADSYSVKNTLNKILLENPKENIAKKLVMIKCRECGEVAPVVLPVENNKVIYDKPIICRNCQETLNVDNIKPGKYECASCGTIAGFYVCGDIKELCCKNCKSVIDLIWHDKKEIYLSPNLIKR